MKKLIDLLNRIILPVIRLYWFIFRPKTKGTKCVIEHNKKILLIKNNYGKKKWNFPGGGVKRNENPKDAVKREVKEETGLDIHDIKFLGDFISEIEYKKDRVYCFSAKSSTDELNLHKYEILEAGWFSSDNIPEPFGKVAGRAKTLYEKDLISK